MSRRLIERAREVPGGFEGAESVEALASALPGALARAARGAGAVLLLADEPGEDLVPRGLAPADRRRRPPAVPGGGEFPPLPAAHPLARWLARAPVALASGGAGEPAAARGWLKRIGLDAALGLAGGAPGRVVIVGVALLARGAHPFGRRRLGALAREAALVVETTRLRERLAAAHAGLARADRLVTLGTLTASLAHELRNPLVAIKTFAQLLPERYDDPEFRTGFAAIALSEVERASALLGELLEFARSPGRIDGSERAEASAARPLRAEDVNAILAQMLTLAEGEARRRRVRIAPRLDPALPRVPVDPDRMKQLFLNLLLNAIQAIEGEEGEVVVETAARRGPEGAFVAVAVRDTGTGIAPADLPSLFTPFFSRKPHGVGLGLAVCREIVRAHGGRIEVVSEPGRGTTVSVRLPIPEPAAARAPASPPRATESPGDPGRGRAPGGAGEAGSPPAQRGGRVLSMRDGEGGAGDISSPRQREAAG
jgi:signal transduction histidine kinase